MVTNLAYFQATVFILLWYEVVAFSGHNTPPVFDFKREWIIQENEPVGSRITKVRTRDEEGDPIVYGIAPAVYVDGSQYFRITKDSGDVYLAKNLAGQGGNDFYLYITANDGHQTAKIEVYVRVLEANLRYPSEPTLDIPFSTSRPPEAATFFVRGIDGSGHEDKVVGRPFPGRPFVPVVPYPAHPSSINRKDKGRTQAVIPPNTAPSSTTIPILNGDQPPVRQIPAREGDGQETHTETHGKEGAEPGLRTDVTSTVLPAIAITGLAPIVIIALWILHRRCQHREKIAVLKKAASTSNGANNHTNTAFGYSTSTPLHPLTSLISSADESGSHSCPNTEPGTLLSKDSKWEFPRHQLQFLGILGEGCFGQVWKCEISGVDETKESNIVAVKTHRENATEKEKKDLVAELEIMKLLDPHPNVVTLLGCCTTREPILVIMEYVSHGKLQTYLRDSRAERMYGNFHPNSKHLTAKDLTAFAYHVAKGMEYLSNKGIIHRDLAARNILVDDNKVCKVADFGFARDIMTSHVYERKSEGRLPIRWMAPESLHDNIYTTKTDVWSFGVLLWEIVTLGSTPYPGQSASEVVKKVKEGYRLEKPEHCRREMYNIMFYCWERDPAHRPSFTELVCLLDRLLISEHIYIELERFPDHSYYNVTDLSGERL